MADDEEDDRFQEPEDVGEPQPQAPEEDAGGGQPEEEALGPPSREKYQPRGESGHVLSLSGQQPPRPNAATRRAYLGGGASGRGSIPSPSQAYAQRGQPSPLQQAASPLQAGLGDPMGQLLHLARAGNPLAQHAYVQALQHAALGEQAFQQRRQMHQSDWDQRRQMHLDDINARRMARPPTMADYRQLQTLQQGEADIVEKANTGEYAPDEAAYYLDQLQPRMHALQQWIDSHETMKEGMTRQKEMDLHARQAVMQKQAEKFFGSAPEDRVKTVPGGVEHQVSPGKFQFHATKPEKEQQFKEGSKEAHEFYQIEANAHKIHAAAISAWKAKKDPKTGNPIGEEPKMEQAREQARAEHLKATKPDQAASEEQAKLDLHQVSRSIGTLDFMHLDDDGLKAFLMQVAKVKDKLPPEALTALEHYARMRATKRPQAASSVSEQQPQAFIPPSMR